MAVPPALARTRIAGRRCCASCLALGLRAAQNADPLNIPDTQLEPLTGRTSTAGPPTTTPPRSRPSCKSCDAVPRQQRPRRQRPIHGGALAGLPARRAAAAATTAARRGPSSRRISGRCAIAKHRRNHGPADRLFRARRRGLALSHPEFHTPLYRRPRDLVVAGQSPAQAPIFPTGPRSAASTTRRSSSPITTAPPSRMARSTARSSKSAGSRIRSRRFSIQIQGSARVRLEDGTMLRVNYDAHNGRPYVAIGRFTLYEAARSSWLAPSDPPGLGQLRALPPGAALGPRRTAGSPRGPRPRAARRLYRPRSRPRGRGSPCASGTRDRHLRGRAAGPEHLRVLT